MMGDWLLLCDGCVEVSDSGLLRGELTCSHEWNVEFVLSLSVLS